jgi:hypothetical protein
MSTNEALPNPQLASRFTVPRDELIAGMNNQAPEFQS